MRALLCDPERRAFACAERRIFSEQSCEAFEDDGQHLGFRGGRPEVNQPLQLGGHALISTPLEAKLALQLLIHDPQVRDLRLQGAELGIPVQKSVLVPTLIGEERRLLHDQRLRLLVHHRRLRPLLGGRL